MLIGFAYPDGIEEERGGGRGEGKKRLQLAVSNQEKYGTNPQKNK